MTRHHFHDITPSTLQFDFDIFTRENCRILFSEVDDGVISVDTSTAHRAPQRKRLSIMIGRDDNHIYPIIDFKGVN